MTRKQGSDLLTFTARGAPLTGPRRAPVPVQAEIAAGAVFSRLTSNLFSALI